MTRPLCFLLSFLFFFSLSQAIPASLNPLDALKSFSINYIQEVGNCSYRVNITTSCSSPSFTRDEIGILFGDAHGNQVYEPRLDNITEGAFRKCGVDIFKVDGVCADQICYLYLYRSGTDGWIPETVEISSSYDIEEPVQFTYNNSIPSNTWYGFNLCQFLSPPPPRPVLPPPPPPSPSSSHGLTVRKWLVYVIPVAEYLIVALM